MFLSFVNHCNLFLFTFCVPTFSESGLYLGCLFDVQTVLVYPAFALVARQILYVLTVGMAFNPLQFYSEFYKSIYICIKQRQAQVHATVNLNRKHITKTETAIHEVSKINNHRILNSPPALKKKSLI